MVPSSPEGFRLDGRLQDEDDDQERKKQKPAQRHEGHLKHLSTVGAGGSTHTQSTLTLNEHHVYLLKARFWLDLEGLITLLSSHFAWFGVKP